MKIFFFINDLNEESFGFWTVGHNLDLPSANISNLISDKLKMRRIICRLVDDEINVSFSSCGGKQSSV